MNNYIFLGREHDIALAELISLYGDNFKPVLPGIVKTNQTVKIADTGSLVKSSQLLMECGKNWQEAIRDNIEPWLSNDARTNIGISVYGQKISGRQVSNFAYSIKKLYKTKGYSIRTVPNKSQELNSAKIINSKLQKPGNLELNVIVLPDKVLVTSTNDIQNIDRYSFIDENKPHIDPINGMLPHKLAKTMLNLAQVQAGECVLDAFCGSGTVLMEAAQKKAILIGSDINQDMVKHSQENLNWIENKLDLQISANITKADATTASFPKFDKLVSETYLGPPLKKMPEQAVFEKNYEQINELHLKFFKNLHNQIDKDHKIVLALPAWRDNDRIIDLKVVDDLENLGYNIASFEGVKELLYFRPYQVVARRILVLVRK